MKRLLPALLLLSTTPFARGEDPGREANFLSHLHRLQYTETPRDLARLIRNCPAPKPDAGDDNTEIAIRTELYGFPARGEYNFHKGVLVSHGFEILAPTYRDAHTVFLDCVRTLNGQVEGLVLSAIVPVPLGDEDPVDGPADEITISIDGAKGKASFQLRLDMRRDSIVVRWGAQPR